MFNKQISRSIFLVSMAVLLFAGAAFNFYLNASEKRNYSNVTLDRIMSHSTPGEPCDYTPGYVQSNAFVNGKTVQCCIITSNNMYACDLNNDDESCR